MCKEEGLSGGELEWQLRNSLTLHFGHGPMPSPTYTLLELRDMTVVKGCLFGCWVARWRRQARCAGPLGCTFWALPGWREWWFRCRRVVGANVGRKGTMTLQDLVANGVMHTELESHVSGCLDREGVVSVIYTVTIYRSGGTFFDPRSTWDIPSAGILLRILSARIFRACSRMLESMPTL
jgi:hypothetical protein